MKAPNLFSQLAAAGLTLLIAIQALLNITVVLGLGPAKGVPLPLLSFGRSSLITTLLAIGILLHISQRKEINRSFG
jgi:cell division protein FtsW